MGAAEKEESAAIAAKFGKDQLKAFVERVERLEEEKKTIADDIRDVYAEAKANGFDVKTLREVVKLRKQEAHERAEQQALLETYLHALGMLIDAPAPAPPKPETPKPTPKGEPRGGGLTPDQIKAAADRAEARSRACAVPQDIISSSPPGRRLSAASEPACTNLGGGAGASHPPPGSPKPQPRLANNRGAAPTPGGASSARHPP